MHKVIGLILAGLGVITILFSASITGFAMTYSTVPLTSATVDLSVDQQCYLRTCTTPASAQFSPASTITDQSGTASFSLTAFDFATGEGVFPCSGGNLLVPAYIPPRILVTINSIPQSASFDLGNAGYQCPEGPRAASPPEPQISYTFYLNPNQCTQSVARCEDFLYQYSNYVIVTVTKTCVTCGVPGGTGTTTTTTSSTTTTTTSTDTTGAPGGSSSGSASGTSNATVGDNQATASIFTAGGGAALVILGAFIFTRKERRGSRS